MRIVLGQYDTGWLDPTTSLNRAERVVAAAAHAGAQLVVLPEMCPSGFTMDAERFAEQVDGPSPRRLAALAREHGVRVLAGVATRRAGGAFNSALLFDNEGELVAAYDKQRLFAYAGEATAFRAGHGPIVFEIDGVRFSPFICYDLRFPDLFQAVGPYVDVIVVLANWPSARQTHWEALLQARAIENQCFVVAVNRTGVGGGLDYVGGSAGFGPWGEKLLASGDPVSVEVCTPDVSRVRQTYPFSTDRRESPPFVSFAPGWDAGLLNIQP